VGQGKSISVDSSLKMLKGAEKIENKFVKRASAAAVGDSSAASSAVAVANSLSANVEEQGVDSSAK